LDSIESLILRGLNPFFSSFYSAGVSFRSSPEEDLSREELIELSKKLKDENVRLSSEVAKLKVLEDENEILKNYLNFLEPRKIKYLMANVISRGEIEESDPVLTIDKGEKDGIRSGLAVVDSRGAILGKIIETKKTIAKVYLVTNKDCKFAVSVENGNKTSGTTSGELGLSIRMDFIPQTEKLSEGEMIITSGLEISIPRGMIIGKISSINKESNEIWQSAIIDPYADTGGSTIVSILIPD